MTDIEEMQAEHNRSLRLFKRWIIAETDEGFVVHVWTADSVAPFSTYPIKELAAARLLQVMGITHAVVPQNYPERVCVGFVTDEDGTEHPLDTNGAQ